MSEPLLPLFLRLDGLPVVVVGAGEVGARKAASLHEARARVTLVDASPCAAAVELESTGKTGLVRRAFEARDLDGAWLAIAATDDPRVNEAVARAAEERRIFVNAVDDPPRCSAFFASTIRRDPLVVAISSSGEAPALAKLLREIVEHVLPEERWIERARELRDRWRAEKTPIGSRFEALVREIAGRAT